MSGAADDQSSLVGILNRVQGWTVAADQKISVITAIQTIACGFLFPELRDWIRAQHTSACIRVFLVIGAALLAVGIGYSLRALFPVIKEKTSRSATFFGSIQGWTLNEYRRHLAAMTPEDWHEDYVSQIHVNSTITTRKFQRAQRSVQCFGVGLAILGACYVAALAGF
jgi:Pycsar effector protein